MQILANRLKCKKCNDIIESKGVHDFVWCSCRSVAVDGGKYYLKRTGNWEDMLDLSVFAHSQDCWWQKDWVQCSCGVY